MRASVLLLESKRTHAEMRCPRQKVAHCQTCAWGHSRSAKQFQNCSADSEFWAKSNGYWFKLLSFEVTYYTARTNPVHGVAKSHMTERLNWRTDWHRHRGLGNQLGLPAGVQLKAWGAGACPRVGAKEIKEKNYSGGIAKVKRAGNWTDVVDEGHGAEDDNSHTKVSLRGWWWY